MSKKTLSLDLRERVVSAVAAGMSRRQAAERFGVSAASAVRWCAREKAGIGSESYSTPSPQANAQTSSPQLDTTLFEKKPL